MNTATGTRNNRDLEQPDQRSDLRLVAGPAKSRHPRTFRIGVSEDLFSVRKGSAEALAAKARDTFSNSRSDEPEGITPGLGGKTGVSSRPVAFALTIALGLLLGYLVGRRRD